MTKKDLFIETIDNILNLIDEDYHHTCTCAIPIYNHMIDDNHTCTCKCRECKAQALALIKEELLNEYDGLKS